MSAVEYKTEQEVQKLGIDILYKGLGATDFIRFIQQFNQGYGTHRRPPKVAKGLFC